jgi:hypothetical protein
MKLTHIDFDYTPDFYLFGLITPIKDYILAWQFYQYLQIPLANLNQVRVPARIGSEMELAAFGYQNEHLTFYLIRNRLLNAEKFSKPWVLPELKEYDYLARLTDETESCDVEEWATKLKTLPSVQLVKHFNPSAIKSVENLEFEYDKEEDQNHSHRRTGL